MNATEVLAELTAAGVTVTRHGDRLRLAPADAIPPDLLERARECKADLLRLFPEPAPIGDKKTSPLTYAPPRKPYTRPQVVARGQVKPASVGTLEPAKEEKMPSGKEHYLLTTKEAAELLRLNEQSLRIMRIEGRGPRFCKVGSRVFYAMTDLEEYLANRTFASTAQAKAALAAEKEAQR